jgi:hypothetical protein
MGLMLGPFARVHDVADGDGQCEEAGGNQQQLRQAEHGDQGSREPGAEHSAQRGADGNDGKQPLALVLGVQVVGERPKLRHDHQVEDPDPQEENRRNRNLGPGQPIECHQTHDEERGDRVEQSAAWQPVCQGAIGGHQHQQQQSLACREVRLQLRSALGREDQRFPHRSDAVVGGEQEKDVERQE